MPIRVNRVVVDERDAALDDRLRPALPAIFAIGALALLIDAAPGGHELAAFEAIGASAAHRQRRRRRSGSPARSGSFEPFSDLSTGSDRLMWLGRVEIIPVAVLLTRAYWRA